MLFHASLHIHIREKPARMLLQRINVLKDKIRADKVKADHL